MTGSETAPEQADDSATPDTAVWTRRKWLFRLVFLLGLFLIVELASYICLYILNRRYPMDPMAEIVPERIHAILFHYYDPDLGWVYDRVR